MSFFSSAHVHEELYLKPKGQNVDFVQKYSIDLQAFEFAPFTISISLNICLGSNHSNEYRHH